MAPRIVRILTRCPDESILWNGVLLDITDAVEAEETAQFLAEMLDSAPNSVLIHDYEGRFLYAQPQSSRIARI